jgi:hypothetical protein
MFLNLLSLYGTHLYVIGVYRPLGKRFQIQLYVTGEGKIILAVLEG